MKITSFAIFYFVALISIAHFFVPPEYNWQQHTVSDLAAQKLPNQWIMRTGFIGFGLLLNIGILSKFIASKKIFYPDLLLMLYGLAVLMSGFFSAAPFLEGVSVNLQEDKWHSFFAQAAGILFSAGILFYIFSASNTKERSIHIVFLILVTGTSAIFGLEENGIIYWGRGAIQRVLYSFSFIWILFSQYLGS